MIEISYSMKDQFEEEKCKDTGNVGKQGTDKIRQRCSHSQWLYIQRKRMLIRKF